MTHLKNNFLKYTFCLFVAIVTIAPFIGCGNTPVYSENSDRAAIMVGDADGNGTVNMLDIVALRRYLLNGTENPVSSRQAADTDGNGNINMLDVIVLRRHLINSTENPLATPAPTEAPTQTPTDAPTTPPNEEDVTVAQRIKENFSTSATARISGDTAIITTEEGLLYTASGYIAFNDAPAGTPYFTINSGFTVTFNTDFLREFNRYTLCYYSTAPLRATVNYYENNVSSSETFFLEAGTDSFNCLIKNYLNGTYATYPESITFETYDNASADFMLLNFETEVYPVFSSDTYYIENSRYKLGVRLMWGGGISYILDKENPVQGLGNLINQADEGRLVQQSYYGTRGNQEYTPGYYNGSLWAYNPVQGGDTYGNHSRIIDVVVENYSVYIKAQPLDWSLNGSYTPSYMENSYTLYPDRIQVDNRFVDFSNWEHPYTHQELPAFYTVSYLDTFTWYDGSKGWTGDALSSRNNLNFWGDAQYEQDCRFFVKKSNDETWCAWTSSQTGYGIGLYVPKADSFFAGRFCYNGSPDPLNGACNYVAPINSVKLVSFKALEYSYLITTGTVNEIRSTFAENYDFTDNASLQASSLSTRVDDATATPFTIDFSSQESASLLQATSNTEIKYDRGKGAVKLKATGSAFDVHVTLNMSSLNLEEPLSASNYTKIIIEYMIPGKTSTRDGFEIFLCTGSSLYPEAGKSVMGGYVYDGSFHTAELSLSGLSFWDGQLNGLRFDYFGTCSSGDEILIRSITFA